MHVLNLIIQKTAYYHMISYINEINYRTSYIIRIKNNLWTVTILIVLHECKSVVSKIFTLIMQEQKPLLYVSF